MSKKTWTSLIIPLAAFLSIAWVAFANLSSSDLAEMLHRPKALSVAFVWAFLSCQLPFFTWAICMKLKSPSAKWSTLYRIFSLATVSRYVPAGQVVQYFAVHQYSKEEGFDKGAVFSFFFILVSGFMAGIMLFLVTAPVVVPRWPIYLSVLGMMGWLAVLVSLSSTKLTRLMQVVLSKVWKQAPTLSTADWRIWIVGIPLASAAWISMAMAYWVMLQGEGSSHQFGFVLASVTGASLIGYATFLTPGGIGVREGVATAFLAQQLPLGRAGLAALTVSCMIVICELSLGLPYLLADLRKKLILNGQVTKES